MAVLNFPGSPLPGNQYTENGVTWQWDGISWNVVGSTQNGYTGSAGTNGTNGYVGSQGDIGYTNIDYGIIHAMRTY